MYSIYQFDEILFTSLMIWIISSPQKTVSYTQSLLYLSWYLSTMFDTAEGWLFSLQYLSTEVFRLKRIYWTNLQGWILHRLEISSIKKLVFALKFASQLRSFQNIHLFDIFFHWIACKFLPRLIINMIWLYISKIIIN